MARDIKTYFLFLILISILMATVGIVSQTTIPKFVGAQVGWGGTLYEQGDVNLRTDMNVALGPTEITNNVNVCRNAAVSILQIQRSTFSESSLTLSTACYSAACPIESTGLGNPSGDVTWISSAAYSNVMGTSNYRSGQICKIDRPPQGFSPTLYRVTANYYSTPSTSKGSGVANLAVFCNANLITYDNTGGSESTIGNWEITATTNSFSYLLSQLGQHRIRTDLVIGDCAAFVRTIETSPAHTRDCVYPVSPSPFSGLRLSGNTLTFNVMDGPQLVASQFRINVTTPGSTTDFSINITNNGDMDANITTLSFTDNASNTWGVTPGSLNLALPFTVSANGGNVTLTGTVTAPSPSTTTNYAVTASMGWVSLVPIIGPCGSSATSPAVTAVDNVIVTTNLSSYFNQLDFQVFVDPTGIIWGKDHWITVNVSASRGGQDVEGTLRNPNVTISRWNNESDPPSWEYAPGWNPSNQNICDSNAWGDDIYLQYPDDAHGNASNRYRVHYVSNVCTSLGNDWPIGVYRLAVSTSDLPPIPNPQNYTITRYFTIYSLPCQER